MSGDLRAWFSRFPEGWWGYHWAPPQPMSAVELVGTPTIDARLMATLWAVMHRRKSVMLSSEAPQAGKTTALSALVDFLPDDTTGIFVRGWWEDYDWTDEIPAGTGYLLPQVSVRDTLPVGFIYQAGSARVGESSIVDPIGAGSQEHRGRIRHRHQTAFGHGEHSQLIHRADHQIEQPIFIPIINCHSAMWLKRAKAV